MKKIFLILAPLFVGISNAHSQIEIRGNLPYVTTNQLVDNAKNTIQVETAVPGLVKIIYSFNSGNFTQLQWIYDLSSKPNLYNSCKFDSQTMSTVLRENFDPSTDVRVVMGMMKSQILVKNRNYEIIHTIGNCQALSIDINSLFWLGTDSEIGTDPRFAVVCQSQNFQEVAYFLDSFYVNGPSYQKYSGDDRICGEKVSLPYSKANENSYDGFHSWQFDAGEKGRQRTFKFMSVDDIGIFVCQKDGFTLNAESLSACSRRVIDFNSFSGL